MQFVGRLDEVLDGENSACAGCDLRMANLIAIEAGHVA